jgi:hypothetical protein
MGRLSSSTTIAPMFSFIIRSTTSETLSRGETVGGFFLIFLLTGRWRSIPKYESMAPKGLQRYNRLIKI